MATGKKIILIILDLLLLTLVLPMTWDYYNFMEYDWITTTSSNIPFIGKYMIDYLFWGNIRFNSHINYRLDCSPFLSSNLYGCTTHFK